MENKVCTKCGIEKDMDHYRSIYYVAVGRSYTENICKDCGKIRDAGNKRNIIFRSSRAKLKRLKRLVNREQCPKRNELPSGVRYLISYRIRAKVNNRLLGIMARPHPTPDEKKNTMIKCREEWNKKNKGYSTEWARRNRLKSRSYYHNRQKLQRETSDGTVTGKALSRIMESQNNLCNFCSADLNEVQYHIDHMIPLSKSGKHTIGNIQFLCQTCNLSKADKILTTT